MKDDKTLEMAGACATLIKVRTLMDKLHGKLQGEDEVLAQEIWEEADLYSKCFMGELEDWVNECAIEHTGFGFNLKTK